MPTGTPTADDIIYRASIGGTLTGLIAGGADPATRTTLPVRPLPGNDGHAVVDALTRSRVVRGNPSCRRFNGVRGVVEGREECAVAIVASNRPGKEQRTKRGLVHGGPTTVHSSAC